jgi:hypothetical protein
MVSNSVWDTLQSTADRSKLLREWAYKSFDLAGMQEPPTIRTKSCFICVYHTHENPTYANAKERARKNLYDEILALETLVNAQNQKISELKKVTDFFNIHEVCTLAGRENCNSNATGYAVTTADNFQRIELAATSLYDKVNVAIETKQRNPTLSIATQIADLKEAYALIFREFSTIAQETLDYKPEVVAQVSAIAKAAQADPLGESQSGMFVGVVILIALAAGAYFMYKKKQIA